jgi:hypothetical protein
LIAITAAWSGATAEEATQTNWFGGPGVPGPVLDWGDTFAMEDDVNWYSTSGQLALEFAAPVEHVVHGTYTRANSAIPADIDGDGDTDVLGAAGRYAPPYFFTGRVDWWENVDGAGTVWIRYTVDDNFVSAPSVDAADIDGDEDIDVVGTARGSVNFLVWWENSDGSGITWIEHDVSNLLQDGNSVYAADIDGDEDIDIVATDPSYNDVVWFENADGTGSAWTHHEVDGGFGGAESAYSVDMDEDDDMDVLAAAYSADDITWWENIDGVGGSWVEHTVDGFFDGARSVYAADVDGDEDMDVMGAAWLGSEIAWWENTDGSGTNWAEHSVSGFFYGASSVVAADIDGDEDIDIAGTAFYADDMTWWENIDGTGTNFVQRLVEGDFDEARDVSVGDMDSDGDVDVLGAAHAAGDIIWWDVTRYEPFGELTSSILDTDTIPQWESLNWFSEQPPRTMLYFQVRSSSDPGSMGAWSEDIEVPGDLGTLLTDGDRYVQYKALLETADQARTPILEEVTIRWTFMSGYPPVPIEDLTIQHVGSDALLSWTPVTEDTQGSPVEVSYYAVFMSPDNPYFVPTPADSIGTVIHPDTTFVDVNALLDPARFYNVKAVVED